MVKAIQEQQAQIQELKNKRSRLSESLVRSAEDNDT